MTHLLIVSQDPRFRTTLRRSLKNQNCRTTAIDDNEVAVALVVNKPDIILLDIVGDPDDSSLEICKRLRGWNAVPIIISSFHDDAQTKVKALDAGADDYLVRPFDTDELLARVRAIRRRVEPQPDSSTPVISVGSLIVNFHTRTVLLDKQPINLTHKEYELLKTLILARGQTLTYRTLLECIGGKQNISERSAIRTLVKRLRAKLGDDLKRPTYILTESGLGYRFNSALPFGTASDI